MTRFRLVTRTSTITGTEEHVSSVVQTFDEVRAGMEVEAQLAREAGWMATFLRRDDPRAMPELVCAKPHVVRTLTIRETDPFNDEITRDGAV